MPLPTWNMADRIQEGRSVARGVLTDPAVFLQQRNVVGLVLKHLLPCRFPLGGGWAWRWKTAGQRRSKMLFCTLVALPHGRCCCVRSTFSYHRHPRTAPPGLWGAKGTSYLRCPKGLDWLWWHEASLYSLSFALIVSIQFSFSSVRYRAGPKRNVLLASSIDVWQSVLQVRQAKQTYQPASLEKLCGTLPLEIWCAALCLLCSSAAFCGCQTASVNSAWGSFNIACKTAFSFICLKFRNDDPWGEQYYDWKHPKWMINKLQPNCMCCLLKHVSHWNQWKKKET